MEHCGETESRLSRRAVYSPTLLPQTSCQVIVDDPPLLSWNHRLAQLSNLASIICVVDCTVLPLLTVLLSVLGLAEQPHRWKWLHELGHGVAIFFVLPGTEACLDGITTVSQFVEILTDASLYHTQSVGLLLLSIFYITDAFRC
jgi:MerC mercury resistance protein